MLKDAIAIGFRDGYFDRGAKLMVEVISPSIYRAYGKDHRGYQFNCLVSSSKIQLIEKE